MVLLEVDLTYKYTNCTRVCVTVHPSGSTQHMSQLPLLSRSDCLPQLDESLICLHIAPGSGKELWFYQSGCQNCTVQMDNSCTNFTNQSKRAHGHKKPLHDLWEVLPAWRGGEGGKGTSGVSWGWGYTWVVALKGVSGKCALPAAAVFSLVRNVPFQIDTFPFQTSFQFSTSEQQNSRAQSCMMQICPN